MQHCNTPAASCAAAVFPMGRLSWLGTQDEVIVDCVQEAVGLRGAEFACKCAN